MMLEPGEFVKDTDQATDWSTEESYLESEQEEKISRTVDRDWLCGTISEIFNVRSVKLNFDLHLANKSN